MVPRVLTICTPTNSQPLLQNHRKNVNDAKMRAVAQKVPTYDDFHQMVLGADLKPMEKKDKGKVSMFEGLSMDKKTQYFGSDLYKQTQRAETFGAQPTKASSSGAETGGSAGTEDKGTSITPPGNPMEFTREWQKSCRTADTRARYLAALPAQADWWGRIFTGGIDVGILGEIFRCWAEGWEAEASVGTHPGCKAMQLPDGHTAARAVAEAMVGLARTSRYQLNLSLMSSDELDALRSLCENVRSTLQTEVAAEDDADAAKDDTSTAGAVLAQFCERYNAYLQAEGNTEQLPMAE